MCRSLLYASRKVHVETNTQKHSISQVPVQWIRPILQLLQSHTSFMVSLLKATERGLRKCHFFLFITSIQTLLPLFVSRHSFSGRTLTCSQSNPTLKSFKQMVRSFPGTEPFTERQPWRVLSRQSVCFPHKSGH